MLRGLDLHAPRTRLDADHNLVQTRDRQVGAGEQEQPGTKIGQAIEQRAETGLEVGADAETEVFQVCGEERPGRVVQRGLAREDDALGLALLQPGRHGGSSRAGRRRRSINHIDRRETCWIPRQLACRTTKHDQGELNANIAR